MVKAFLLGIIVGALVGVIIFALVVETENIDDGHP